jgi:glycosyltransferase involved in cell wall biosynthesis
MRWVEERAGKYSLREQLALPWHAWREGLALLHVPHYVVPLAAPCPLVVTIHDIIHLKFARHLSPAARAYAAVMLRAATRRARRIITVSEFSRRDIVQTLGVPPEKVVAIHNGIAGDTVRVEDAAALATARARLGWDGPFLLNVSNVRMRHKNLPLLIEAFGTLLRGAHAGLRLAIAGGPPTPELRALLERVLGPRAGQVLFPGYLARTELLALYSAAEVFVWPSLYEGFGLPPLEAMACGTPVVSSDVSAMPEVLGDAPRYASPHDAGAFGEAVRGLLDDPAARAAHVARGLAQAARYDWSANARATLAVYRDVLQR